MLYPDPLEDSDLEENNYIGKVRNIPSRERHASQKQRPSAPSNRHPAQAGSEPAAPDETEGNFEFSYHASRYERVWIVDSLSGFYESRWLDDSPGGLYEGKWLDDVLRLIKGGKEAHVYQCLANDSVVGLESPYIAAKVYRPRQFRNLKNDHLYREGRQNLDANGRGITNDGMIHAMAKRTEYGLELLHTSWIVHEFKTLQVLYDAGLDVPKPLATANNAILMAYIGGDDVPAPTLNSVSLGRKEAQRLFDRVIYNIEGMLARQRIHADLSAYNILYWDGEITLIDFPQAIEPLANRNAFRIFERDVTRVCDYFSRRGVKSNPSQLAAAMWKTHHYHPIPDVHPALLDPESEKDQAYWRNWVSADGV